VKNEETKYYKVVQVSQRQNRKCYQSYCAKSLPAELVVRYKVHRWVEAPLGGLLVFDDYDVACKYIIPSVRHEVWQVSVKDEILLPARRQYLGINNAQSYQQIWKITDAARIGYPFWPYGTRAFKYIKLLKKVS